jgi:uncharacterized protein YndB with AHSA1/START domain
MVKIEGTTVIARPVEDVFDFVADQRNEPTYNPRMVRVQKLTPGPITQGTRWSAVVKSGRRTMDLTITVTDFARPTRLSSTTTMSTAEIRGAVTFDPHPAGTRMEWTWDLRPTGALRLLGPVLGYVGRRQEAQIWAGLKQLLEGQRPQGAAKLAISGQPTE